jgi:hypothetical protein
MPPLLTAHIIEDPTLIGHKATNGKEQHFAENEVVID